MIKITSTLIILKIPYPLLSSGELSELKTVLTLSGWSAPREIAKEEE